MRGEYEQGIGNGENVLGSSPHAWGILTLDKSLGQHTRFIPTCVGNTGIASKANGIKTVHPHMRGEYFTVQSSHDMTSGSSPHAWGIQLFKGLTLAYRRFIPTCVGNTFWFCLAPTHRPVHPHMRGEYLLRPQCSEGINTVHPHMRGEYKLVYHFAVSHCGSSPHAWGIHCFLLLSVYCVRFIPTCVGNTQSVSSSLQGYSVHPHMRGEYCLYAYSSTLALRFIPTCVGNTVCSYKEQGQLTVHPHMRGEYR